MDDAESILVPGYRLDRYELLCPIASGGMATVWLARLRGKRGFEKLFAVKMIKTEHTSDPRFQEMFLDEARLASAIEHPNVAQIIDLGEQDGLLYTVMEWVDGESLAKISRLADKRGTPMPPGIAIRIMADACSGLHAAHELRDEEENRLGVVHRDVSPQNILVTTVGAVKVIDFGVAKAVNRRGVNTESGVVKGKVRYMAPEQVSTKKNVDHRADVWAAGICLYEIVTGKPPFDELGDVDVIRKLMSDDPIPNLDAVPKDLEALFASTLTRDPEARFATAAALRRALEATLDKMDQTVTSDDVADFLKDKLPDLAKKRRTTVNKAVDDAKARGLGTPERPSGASSGRESVAEDVAFAPTIASAPRAKKPLPGDESGSGLKTTAGTSLSEQVGERRASVFPWVFAIMVVCGVGASLWYANQHFRSTTPAAPSPDPVAAKSSAPPPPSASETPVLSSSSAPVSTPSSSAFEIGSAEIDVHELPSQDASVAIGSGPGRRFRPIGPRVTPSASASAEPPPPPKKPWNRGFDEAPSSTPPPVAPPL